MKATLLFALLLTLAACQMPDGRRFDAETAIKVATDAAIAADRDVDGRVSNRELKDAAGNPLNWIAVIGAILGAAGAASARTSSKKVDKVEAETDEQWDELRKLDAKP
jgi:hypothetical protein